MVAAGVVVLVCVVLPAHVVVPNPGELLGGGWLPAVQGAQEVLVDGLAPAFPAGGADLEGLGQEVFLGVHQVDQVPQGAGGVAPQPDVHVDAAGGVGVCPCRPQGPNAGLHRFEVFPAAHRGDELCALVAAPGDARVGNAPPLAAFAVDRDPSVVGTAFVVHRGGVPVGGKNPGDRPGGGLAGDVVDFEFEAEGLVFHGEAPFFRRRLFPPARVARLSLLGGFPPGGHIHHSAGPKSQPLFFGKRRPGFLIHARRPPEKKKKKPGFFRPPGHTRRPETDPPEPRPGTLLRFAVQKSCGAQDFSASPCESPPGHRTFRLRRAKVCPPPVRADPAQTTCPPPGHTAARREEPAGAAGLCPGRGWSDPCCVPGGDRAENTKKSPTYSGRGVIKPENSRKMQKKFWRVPCKSCLEKS